MVKKLNSKNTSKKKPVSGTPEAYIETEEQAFEEEQNELLRKMLDKLDEIKSLYEKNQPVEESGNQWPWIDNKELEKLLGLHERTLATWRENGTLRYTRIGKKIFYNRKEIEQLLWSKFGREVKL